MAQTFGQGDCFDFDDLSVCDGEAKHHEEAAAWSYDDSDWFRVRGVGWIRLE
jgi:hypothetical protein